MATTRKKRPTSPQEIVVREVVDSRLARVKDFVRSYEVDFRENFAGEPAVYVTFRVLRPNQTEPNRTKRLYRVWQEVREDLIRRNATAFPYVEVRGVSER